MKKLKIAKFGFAILLAKCSSTSGSSSGSLVHMGEIGLIRPSSSSPYLSSCAVKITFYHLTKKGSPIEPEVKLIFFDSSYNTLGTTTTRFDPILPDKEQTKIEYVRGPCEQLWKARVLSASDDSLHLGRGYSLRIEGMPEGREFLIGGGN